MRAYLFKNLLPVIAKTVATTEASEGPSDSRTDPDPEVIKVSFTPISALSTLEDGHAINVRVMVLARREDSQWNRSWIVQDVDGPATTVMLVMKRSKRSQEFFNFFEVHLDLFNLKYL